jgi:hypothetical protein
MSTSSSDLRRGSQQVSTNPATCRTYSWCRWADGHTLEDHDSIPHAVSASADPEDYQYDIAFGAVHIPIVTTLLTAPVDGHHREPRVALMARVPGGPRPQEIEVELTFREAAILRDQLADLIEEAQR